MSKKTFRKTSTQLSDPLLAISAENISSRSKSQKLNQKSLTAPGSCQLAARR